MVETKKRGQKMSKAFCDLFDFEEIYEYVVLPSIKLAMNGDCLTTEFISEAGLVCEDNISYHKHLKEFFNEKVRWLTSIYWKDQLQNGLDLDGHKIASVLCRSIIGVKPFSFDINKAKKYIKDNDFVNNRKWLVNNYLVNYKVAIDAALGLIMFDLLNKLDTPQLFESFYGFEPDLLKEEIFENGKLNYYNLPIIRQRHAPFYESVVANMAINDINNRNFDYLGFATILFQLQQYNVLDCAFRQHIK